MQSRSLYQKFRLCPTELNTLIRKMVSNFAPAEQLSLQNFISLRRNNREFVIFPMCKDSENELNQPGLKSIVSLLKNFFSKKIPPAGVLLIPMRMCRGYLKIPTSFTNFMRKHAVLVEIDLYHKTIQVHDSQGWFRKLFYPDKLLQLVPTFHYNPQEHYHAYGVQEGLVYSDNISCGYYLFAYLYHILRTGSSIGCENIKLDIVKDFENKNDFFNQYGIDCLPEQNAHSSEEDEPYEIKEFDFEEFVDKDANKERDANKTDLIGKSENLSCSPGFPKFFASKEEDKVLPEEIEENLVMLAP